jgi:hypothetical protein
MSQQGEFFMLCPINFSLSSLAGSPSCECIDKLKFIGHRQLRVEGANDMLTEHIENESTISGVPFLEL